MWRLMSGARNAERFVLQADDIASRQGNVPHPRADGGRAAGAAVQERRCDASFTEYPGRAIHRVAFRDRSQVEQEIRALERDGQPARVETNRTHGAVVSGNVECSAGASPDRESIHEELERLPVERYRRTRRNPREVRDQADGDETGEPGMTCLDRVERRLGRAAMPPGPVAVDDQLEARAHRGGGQPHSFFTFIFTGSNSKADPSHIDRVARSTITMTFAPSSTGLGTGSRVRMHSIHRRRSRA